MQWRSQQDAETRLTEALMRGQRLEVFEVLCQLHREAFWTASSGPEYMVEKTPRNEFCLPEIFGCFPAARILHIVRDPFDFLASRWRHRDRSLQDRTVEGDVMGWKRSLQLGRLAMRQYPEQYRFLRFDGLVNETAA